jgi:GTP-binding protein
MKFVDYVKIHVASGRGGNGCCSFRREKFIPHGGPDGGDGGDGGGVMFQGTRRKTTLLDFHFQRHFKARDGAAGKGKDMHGKSAPPLVIPVPLGTVVKDAESGEVLLEILDEQPHLLLRGGKGGRGNTRFKSATNRVPMEFEEGEEGQARWLELELKLMADVGLVGFPNAGKSTLISRISMARPKIADYPFTTLVPNLGVVKTTGFESFVVADIPGIIAGAHRGAGLGHRFLRHIERTALLLLMVECTGPEGQEPLAQYHVLVDELGKFSTALLEKPRALALTKCDLLPEPEAGLLAAHMAEVTGERVFPISAVTGQGIQPLVRYLARQVRMLSGPERPAPPTDEENGALAPGDGEVPAPPRRRRERRP